MHMHNFLRAMIESCRGFLQVLGLFWQLFGDLQVDLGDHWAHIGRALVALRLLWSHTGHLWCLQAPLWEDLEAP